MVSPGRPTLRCLHEDLEHGWEDVDQLRLVLAGTLDELGVNLHDLAHPVIRHTREVFNGVHSADIQRESISGLYSPMWYKLKTGRWRGAVYVDDSGTAWLCAAGLRRQGEAMDFYKAFAEQIKNGGPEQFLPTNSDVAHARRERGVAELEAWKVSLHRAGQSAFLDTIQTGQPTSVPVTSAKTGSKIANAVIEVVNITDAGDSLVDVTLEFSDIEWSATKYLEKAQEVLMLSICNEPTAWKPGHSSDSQIFSLQSTDGLDVIVDTLQDDDRAGLPAEPQLSHWAKKDLILGSAVNGDAVVTLCGAWLVQSRDAENLPKCPTCHEIYTGFGS